MKSSHCWWKNKRRFGRLIAKDVCANGTFKFEPFTVTFIFEAESPESVSAELDRLPVVRAGLLERHIVALGPWVQIEMLFDKNLMQSGASMPAV
jgi:hypothetical protein